MKAISILLLTFAPLSAGPYPPEAGAEDSTALASNDPRFVAWASEVVAYEPGAAVDEVWQDPSQALGPAEGISDQGVVVLGRGGVIELAFPNGIADGPGPDFAVFENSLSDFFLELAFVEVSSDGETFHRFPNDSLTANPVPAFGTVDPTDVDGLAGKYRRGFGTPFDLAAVGLKAVRIVRLVDVIGGTSLDSSGDVIYDPYPTAISAGFDLDAVGVINQPAVKLEIQDVSVAEGEFNVTWSSRAGIGYEVQAWNLDSESWQTIANVSADSDSTTYSLPLDEESQRLLRVREAAAD